VAAKRKSVFDDNAKNLFLEEVSRTGLLAKSAKVIGVNSRFIKKHLEDNQEFFEAYEEALLMYQESLQAEMHRRAVEGVEEDVYFQGVVCGQKRVYSDSLLTTLTKAKVPEFRDRQKLDVAVSGGVLLTLPPAQSQEQWLASTEPIAELPPAQVEDEDEGVIDVEFEHASRE